jgi:hypothetical protein
MSNTIIDVRSGASTAAPKTEASGISRQAWLDAIAACAPPSDPEAISIQEFADLFTPPLPKTTAQFKLKALVASGRARAVTKPGTDSRGRRITLTAYRLV